MTLPTVGTATIVIGVIWLAYTLYAKVTGAPKTTLREDWEEMKAGLADAADAREQELAERAQREWEQQQQAEQPVYDYDAYSEPTYIEPAPIANTHDDDGWGL